MLPLGPGGEALLMDLGKEKPGPRNKSVETKEVEELTVGLWWKKCFYSLVEYMPEAVTQGLLLPQ